MQNKPEVRIKPNGVAFSGNQIKSAAKDIISRGKKLEDIASKHPMTEAAADQIFSCQPIILSKLKAFWDDRISEPDAYLDWNQIPAPHSKTIAYKGEYTINVNEVPTTIRLTGDILVFDPKNILTDVSITLSPIMTKEILLATKKQISSTTGADVESYRADQCVQCMVLGVDLRENLADVAEFGALLRTCSHDNLDINNTQLGLNQNKYGMLQSASHGAELSPQEELLIDYHEAKYMRLIREARAAEQQEYKIRLNTVSSSLPPQAPANPDKPSSQCTIL